MVTRPGKPTPHGGFTLVEIMVVVMLIGVTVALVGLSIQRNVDREAKMEARRMAAVIDLVRDEAMISGQYYALQLNPYERNYRFLWNPAKWAPPPEDSLFKVRALPEYLRLESGIDAESQIDGLPAILITPTEGVYPFEVSVIGEQMRYVLRLSKQQKIEIVEQEYSG